MLTDLQQRVRRLVGELPVGVDLALAGGAALVLSGVVDRRTRDLDFFAAHPEQVDAVTDLVQAALEDDGLQVTRLLDEPTFSRLQISSVDDTTIVDLATDYRLMAAARTEEGAVLEVAELAADKVLALEARAEARDFVDFAALAKRFTVAELCGLAGRKDPGFEPERLARILEAFDNRPPDEFADYLVDYDRLREAIHAALLQIGELDSAPGAGDRGVDR